MLLVNRTDKPVWVIGTPPEKERKMFIKCPTTRVPKGSEVLISFAAVLIPLIAAIVLRTWAANSHSDAAGVAALGLLILGIVNFVVGVVLNTNWEARRKFADSIYDDMLEAYRPADTWAFRALNLSAMSEKWRQQHKTEVDAFFQAHGGHANRGTKHLCTFGDPISEATYRRDILAKAQLFLIAHDCSTEHLASMQKELAQEIAKTRDDYERSNATTQKIRTALAEL